MLSHRVSMLGNAPADVKRAFDAGASLKRFDAGRILALEQSDCDAFFVVTGGVIRVYKIGESGREVTLYRVRAQESCVLTAFAILSRTAFPAIAVAETEVELVTVPACRFRGWIDRFPTWREYVFANLSRRLTDILDTVEKVTFTRVDKRIASYLLERAPRPGESVAITHERIASDLGTNRVVVSRLLKELEKQGCVKLARGRVTVLDPRHLEIIAG